MQREKGFEKQSIYVTNEQEEVQGDSGGDQYGSIASGPDATGASSNAFPPLITPVCKEDERNSAVIVTPVALSEKGRAAFAAFSNAMKDICRVYVTDVLIPTWMEL